MTQIDTSPQVAATTRTKPTAAGGKARLAVKRAFDVTVAASCLLLFAPLLLLVALAIRLESAGPALFRQHRHGLNGRPFVIYKFRSMRCDDDATEVRQATRDDPRVTSVGAVIRALSIDELPQLLNVLRGEMSIVGPRPHAVSHDEMWGRQIPGYFDRFRMRPGLTGYAQVSGLRGEVRSIEDVRRRVQADNLYIDSWSLKLDLVILLRTVPLLLHDPRAY